jgi:hypothetical protein
MKIASYTKTVLAGMSLFLMAASMPTAQDYADAYGAGAAAKLLRPPPVKQHLLFGGSGHDQFLGCLNCAALDRDAICNAYGPFGNRFNTGSIWNAYGTYGSKYQIWSPWNLYTVSPPAIVDRDGKFYGYLTANKSNPQRTQIPVYQLLTEAAADGTDLDKIRDAYCEQ